MQAVHFRKSSKTPHAIALRQLPFRLNHVNIYLLADHDGWAAIDARFGNEETTAPPLIDETLTDKLRGRGQWAADRHGEVEPTAAPIKRSNLTFG